MPVRYGRVMAAASELERTDRQAWIMYQIMVDRFVNGNTANDWKANRPDVLPEADYYGGDLAGIDAKLREGYFDTGRPTVRTCCPRPIITAATWPA